MTQYLENQLHIRNLQNRPLSTYVLINGQLFIGLPSQFKELWNPEWCTLSASSVWCWAALVFFEGVVLVRKNSNKMCLIDATIQEQLYKDMASRVMCNLSQAMAVNTALDGHHPGFINLQTKAGTALNEMSDHNRSCRERLFCFHCHYSKTVLILR